MKWNRNPKEAPKDGSVIVGNFQGILQPTLAVWNRPSGQWAVAELNVGLYEGEWDDTYFETEYYLDSDLLSWIALVALNELLCLE